MKNKKIKTEYIVLGILIVALTLYLVLRQADRVQYELPKLDTLPIENIQKVEIKKAEGLLSLTKEGDNWFLSSERYPADEEKIKKVLETISQLTLTEMVSQSKNYQRYSLSDNERIEVKAFGKGQLIREFLVGKNTAAYGHTFVKLNDDDRVYQAKGAFHNEFDKKIDELRDKKVLTFDSSEISQVEILAGGKTYQFVKSTKKADPGQDKEGKPLPAVEEVVWLSKDGIEGDKSKIDSYINRLSNLTCSEYIADKKPEDFKNPELTITLKGNRDYSISIFPKVNKDDTNIPAVSSETPYVFMLSSHVADNFTKDVQGLVEKKGK